MPPPSPRTRGRLAVASLGLLLAVPLATQGRSADGPTEHDLRRMDAAQLRDLFTQAEVGTPLVGTARGRLVHLADRRGRLRTGLTNAVWKGKTAEPDGTFVNNWVGGVTKIGSRYAVGPSWLDGRPALVVEYPPGTPLLGNTRDELREVAPGLYLGPLYDKEPCPKLRGWLVLRLEPGTCGRVERDCP